MRAPEWWARDGGLARLLAPFGWAYGLGARLRHGLGRPWQAPLKVICVGNLVAGGAGKTPVTMAVAERLIAKRRVVHVLGRGYGGRLVGPVRVDPARHDASEVGDEALLLAAVAPTWIGRDRRAGAKAAADVGAQVLILDDGYQDPSLAKDLSLVVVDGGFGFGNGRLIPAGPLREPVATGLARASAIVLIGPDSSGVGSTLSASGKPVLRARVAADGTAWRGRPVVAFAGIGRPEKFFTTLAETGARIVRTQAFADHHPYSPAEIDALKRSAATAGATLVTTAKDRVRIPEAARSGVEVLTVHLEWEDQGALDRLLEPIA